MKWSWKIGQVAGSGIFVHWTFLILIAQEDFPVLEHGRLVGILPRSILIKALADGGPDLQVGAVMRRDSSVAEEGDTLESTFEKMREGECSSLPVVRNGHLVGVVTIENIGDWMMVRSALDRAESPGSVEELLRV